MTIVAFEGFPFQAPPTDRLFILEKLRGFAEPTATGVRVNRLAGHLALPSGDVLTIRSAKAPSASLLAWLAYADPTLAGVARDLDVRAFGEDGDIGALTARIFVAELRGALARFGLPRAYVETRVEAMTVRGRIEFAQLARRGGNLARVPCTSWERRPESRLARTLAAATERVRRDPTMRAAVGGELSAIVAAFADSSAVPDEGLLSGTVSLARTETGFAAALCWARMVLREENLGDGGVERSSGYLINLEALFESTVVQALDEAGVTTHGKRPVRYQRASASKRQLDGAMEIDAFCPTLLPGGVVVDAKFKSKLSAGNLQQMVTYCFATGARIAVLVVPTAYSDATTSMSFRDALGGPGVEIRVVALQTDGKSVAMWKRNTSAFVTALERACNDSARLANPLLLSS